MSQKWIAEELPLLKIFPKQFVHILYGKPQKKFFFIVDSGNEKEQLQIL